MDEWMDFKHGTATQTSVERPPSPATWEAEILVGFIGSIPAAIATR
jgi:hypothetical protein